MADWIQKIGPVEVTPPARPDAYASLMRSIAYQQLNGRAAATIFDRFKKLFPKERFPKPESVLKKSIEELRSAGLSNAKSLAIQDVARKKIEGLIPGKLDHLSDEEIIETLTQIRGVGPWTVQMFLLFTLGRPDIWPHTDFGVQKGFQVLRKKRAMPEVKAFLKAGDLWKPHRSTAALYLWRIADWDKK